MAEHQQSAGAAETRGEKESARLQRLAVTGCSGHGATIKRLGEIDGFIG